jgi:hypothetical protein
MALLFKAGAGIPVSIVPESGLEDKKELTLPRRIAIVVALLLMSAAGFAQIPTSGNVYLGYSLNHASTGWNNTGNLNGWELSAEGKMISHVGIVADLSSQYGTLQTPNRYLYGGTSGTFDLTMQMESYLFGPRVWVTVGKFRPDTFMRMRLTTGTVRRALPTRLAAEWITNCVRG